MATIGQAVLLAEGFAVGVAEITDVEAASVAATEPVATVEVLLSSLRATDPALQSAFAAWQAAALAG